MRRCRRRPDVNTRVLENSHPERIRGFLSCPALRQASTPLDFDEPGRGWPGNLTCALQFRPAANYSRAQGDHHDRYAEHFDVLIVGAGPVRHRRGLSPAAEVPGQELRHPRGPRLHRRHLGSVPLSRHPLRHRHVHARLFVQAVDRAEGDRRRAADPELRPRDRRRERHRQEDPLPPPRQARVVVDAGGALDGGGRAHVGRGRDRDRALHLQFPVHVLRLLQIRGRLHAGVFRARATSPAASCIRRNGPRISTTPASAWW